MARTLRARWDHVKQQLTLGDLLLDVAGKVLAALGAGSLFAQSLVPAAWWLIGAGVGMSLVVKAKHWKRFWA
jgi:hypothetical protein